MSAGSCNVDTYCSPSHRRCQFKNISRSVTPNSTQKLRCAQVTCYVRSKHDGYVVLKNIVTCVKWNEDPHVSAVIAGMGCRSPLTPCFNYVAIPVCRLKSCSLSMKYIFVSISCETNGLTQSLKFKGPHLRLRHAHAKNRARFSTSGH